MLVENNTVEAVLSLPGGVFQPYSGVKTSVLLFRKGGRTERVLFLHADADGYKLDANHDTPIEADDLPGLVEAYRGRVGALGGMAAARRRGAWTEKWWFATADELRDGGLQPLGLALASAERGAGRAPRPLGAAGRAEGDRDRDRGRDRRA